MKLMFPAQPHTQLMMPAQPHTKLMLLAQPHMKLILPAQPRTKPSLVVTQLLEEQMQPLMLAPQLRMLLVLRTLFALEHTSLRN
jgi:hypothetical protein